MAKRTDYHRGDWEHEIGYTQAIRIGERVLVSGTTGPVDADFAGQLRNVYETLQASLAHHGASLSQVVKENVFCLDLDALIACQELRKAFYGKNLPVSTWTQVQRLYSPGALVEIEVEALVD